MPNTAFLVASTGGTFWRLYAKLRDRCSFLYSRFGDGDLEVMLGRADSQHRPNPALARDLLDLLCTSNTVVLNGLALHENEPGMVPGLFASWPKQEYQDFVGRVGYGHEFESAVALHYFAVFKPHLLRQLFDLVRTRRKVFVGNQTGEELECLLGPIKEQIMVPYYDAYATIDEWYPRLVSVLTDNDLVFCAAGMATRALNLRLFREGWSGQSVDLGSLVDYACGYPNRTWIRMAGHAGLERLLG